MAAHRPDFEMGAAGRGRSRVAGECGLLDPRALQARSYLQAMEGSARSIEFTTTGAPVQWVQSEREFREIHGSSTFVTATIAFWIKSTASPATGDGIVWAGDATSTGNAFGVSWGPTLASGINFWVNTRGTVANRGITPAMVLGTWNHCVGTFNVQTGVGNTISGYLNGSNAGGTNGSLTTAPSLEGQVPFGIGSDSFRNATSSQALDGRIHGVQYWNRALTSSEVTTLYNGGVPLRALPVSLLSGLRLWWAMGGSYQERQRNIVVDRSGNGFHGFLGAYAAGGALPTFVADAP